MTTTCWYIYSADITIPSMYRYEFVQLVWDRRELHCPGCQHDCCWQILLLLLSLILAMYSRYQSSPPMKLCRAFAKAVLVLEAVSTVGTSSVLGVPTYIGMPELPRISAVIDWSVTSLQRGLYVSPLPYKLALWLLLFARLPVCDGWTIKLPSKTLSLPSPWWPGSLLQMSVFRP